MKFSFSHYSWQNNDQLPWNPNSLCYQRMPEDLLGNDSNEPVGDWLLKKLWCCKTFKICGKRGLRWRKVQWLLEAGTSWVQSRSRQTWGNDGQVELANQPAAWAYAERFWGGFTKSSWGSGGRCESPSGVRGGAPEDFEINAFQRLRTPVSLSFLSQCCYTKIHAIFFIHSHPHHFHLNEVVPNDTLWYQKSQCQRIAQFWVLFFTCTMRLVGVLNFGNSSSLWSKAKRSCSQSYPHALSASPTVGSTACTSTCVLDSLYSPWDDWCLATLMMPQSAAGWLWEICCINDIFPSDSCWTFKTGPKCSTSGEWDPYPATQAAKASFTAFLHHFRSQATKRTRRRTPWMWELSSRLLKSLLRESLPYT